ncbi:carboxymuconolactone decarboxylase family protein [Paraburkholderia bannensis]|uniref:carboxymuconolactone decarboxylase family protein n=1 Tax=Paraburkholderia bannensis TaxID=765414 RepID=UPI002AAF4FBC|nr:carboxymuconolactone decarboxylase family protein [Paraburkholderia bannensis]
MEHGTDATPRKHDRQDRYAQGWQKLKQIDGAAGEKVVAALAPIAPDFGRLLIEFGFGDIYSRPQLDLRAREIATIAALAALGNAQPQLKIHIEAALNVGCTRDEIVEVFMQMALYAGFPAALNALFAAREVFEASEMLAPEH